MSRYRHSLQRLISSQASRHADKQLSQLVDAASASLRTVGGSGLITPSEGKRTSAADLLPPPYTGADARGSGPAPQQIRLSSAANALSGLCSPTATATSSAVRALLQSPQHRSYSTSTIDQPPAGVLPGQPRPATAAGSTVIAEANAVLKVSAPKPDHVRAVHRLLNPAVQ